MNQKLRSIIALILVIAMLLPVGVMAEETKDLTVFYVAKDGNNSNAGTEDAPFATIEGARDAIREAKKAGTLGKDGAVVYIREGEYYIENSIVFNSEDSGTKDAPVVYRNYPDENVSFVGAATIDWENFKPLTDRATLERIIDEDARKNIVVADLFALGFTNLPELSMPGTYSYHPPMPEIHGKQEPVAGDPELVVNGEGMTLARYPNDGYMEIIDVLDSGAFPCYWQDKYEGQSYWVAPEDRSPDPFTISLDDERVTYWTNAKDAMISGLFYYSWASQTVPMASINPEKKAITSTIPSFYGVLAGQSVYVYNLIEEIDVPGEYYVDRKTGKIYLYPPSNNIESVVYTTLDDYMFKFEEAKYIKLKGIDMSYMRSGAVNMSASSHCEIIDSEIEYTGKIAVAISGDECKIYDSFIHDVEGGIDLIGGNRQDLTPGNNVAENNELTRCDRISKTYMAAINATGVGNNIVYNKIHGSDHTIVRFMGNDHTISFNEICDAVKYADDMGAIYAGRNLTCRGNVISHNYFHDIGGATIGNQGNLAVFLDDWFSAADIYGNVFENIEGAGVRCAGSYNKIYNNVFINMTQEAAQLNRSYNYGNADSEVEYRQGIAAVPYKSDVWVEKYPEIVNVIDEFGKLDMNNNIVFKNNLLYNTKDPSVSSEIAETATIENNLSYTSDPGFVDVKNRNYLLKPNSDVYTQNEEFQPIYFTRMGMYSDRAYARTKDAHVYCAYSPYSIENGEKKKNETNPLILKNGQAYVPLRMAVKAIGAEILFDEATENITVTTDSKSMTFTDGAKDKVTLNGVEYTLKAPVININYTNYISLADISEMFEKFVINKGDIYILSSTDGLFNEINDAGLLRYLGEQLSIY